MISIRTERQGFRVSEENKKDFENSEPQDGAQAESNDLDNAQAEGLTEEARAAESARETKEIESAEPEEAPAVTVGGKQKRERRISLGGFIFSAIALVLAAVMTTYVCGNSFYKKKLAENQLQNVVLGSHDEYAGLALIDALFKTYSYYDLSEEEIVDEVLKAYVAATGDIYAEYYNAEEYAAMRADTAGNSEGVGINIINSTAQINGATCKVIQVISVSPGSPAEEAGMKVGDLIVWVGIGDELESVDELGYTAALSKLRGAAGTVAKFTVLRPKSDGSYDTIPYTIERRTVETVSVYSAVSEVDSTVGIVKIARFDLTAPKQFSAAVDKLKESGCTRFVFDVRYNPGGDLNSIIAVLSYFLDEGDVIISTQDRSGAKETICVAPVTYNTMDYQGCNVTAEDIGKYKGLDIVVLCNESTASAAELFTAAMRDYDLADIVGVKTYGKGSMQSIISLSQFGYAGGLKLTTRMYFPPCGVGYDGIGIEPDEVVTLSDAAKEYNIYVLPQALDDQLGAALEHFQK